jgi:two-component system, sensor histidine kinase and response regulator
MDKSLSLLAQNLSAHSPSHLRRLEFLVNTSPLVLYTCEAGGDFRATFVSEGVKALWGYEREQFLADSKFWADRLHPEDVARVLEGLQLLMKTGEHRHEYRFRDHSGDYRWVRDELRLLRDPAGNPLEIVGHCFDITERKLAEAALRESEARLKFIFNGTSDLQVLFRVAPPNGFITETINRAIIENFHGSTGKDMMDFLGRPFEELLAATGLAPQDIEQRRGLYLRVVEQRATVHFETPQTPLRDAVEVEVSPVVDQNGHCTHILWNARNVSERVQAASALHESEERYALATEATLDGIFDWNLATGDSHLSPRLKQILGFRDDELPNDFSAFFGRVHPEDLNWLSQLVVRLNADRTLEKFDQEVRLRRKDGSYCWVVSRGQVVRDPLGQPTRFIGAIRDVTGRKQAEDASAFLAAIVQSSDDSIVGSNLDGTILSWNASSERYWGYTAAEAIGQTNSILFPPDRQHEYADRIAKIRRGEPTERYETLRRRKNGTLVPVSVILSPVKDARGKLLGFAAIYSDMTERNESEARLLAAKQAAEKAAASLRESEERYALVMQATRDGIFDSDPATGIAYHSPRFNEILGYGEDELPAGQCSFFEQVHPEDRPRLLESAARNDADKTVPSFEYEVRARCKDGSYRWVAANGRLLRDAAGNPTRVVGAIRDITKRRQAEEKLAASEKRLRDTLDSLYGFVALYTLDGVLLDINRAPLEAAGLKAEDVLGKPIWETPWVLDTPEEQERLRTIMARAAGGEVVRDESIAVIEGGQHVVIDATFGPLRDRHGVITNVIGSGTDITARKEAEAKLVLAKQVAEIASRAKSEFLANMSHEIRTPMNGIIGLTEVVLESDLNPEQREYLGLVKSSASSLMQIISDILDISKIQAGKMVLRPKEFWVRDLVASTIGAFVQPARAKNLRLNYSVHPAIPEVLLGDASLLKRVLEILLGNAIKFTVTGEVNLEVKISPENFEKLHFQVADTGIGIAADQQRRIFEPFTQVDASSRREFGGTGLGLAISAQLVEMMGGEIWVVSDGRSGSTFHFTARLAAVTSP